VLIRSMVFTIRCGCTLVNRLLKTLTLLSFAAALSGCVIAVNTDEWDDDGDGDSWETRQKTNRQAIAQMELGRTLASVELQLGAPDFEESFLRDDDRFTVLFYRTQRTKRDGRTTKDETTPLVFVDGTLVGWGDAAIEHAVATR
jgi:hypothetical protein